MRQRTLLNLGSHFDVGREQWPLVCRRVGEKGIHSSWATIRETLAGQQRVTANFRTADGSALQVRRATETKPEQAEIYDALGIGHSPGAVRRTVV